MFVPRVPYCGLRFFAGGLLQPWLELLRLAPELLAITLPRQCLFRTALVAWFQIERVLLDVLDDVFLLNLALEAAEGALDGLAFLNLDFSHACNTPSPAWWLLYLPDPIFRVVSTGPYLPGPVSRTGAMPDPLRTRSKSGEYARLSQAGADSRRNPAPRQRNNTPAGGRIAGRLHTNCAHTPSMKILVIGSGAREHAMASKLVRERDVEEVLCVPGNPGIAAVARCVGGDVANPSELLAIATREHVDLTVVGPEVPLSLGVVDFNARARRVYEKCGFVEEGRLRDEHYRLGRWCDVIRMSILDHEWRGAGAMTR